MFHVKHRFYRKILRDVSCETFFAVFGLKKPDFGLFLGVSTANFPFLGKIS